MGPRSFDRGNSPIAANPAAAVGLQWGCDLLIAEINVYSELLGCARQLQWGRDLLIAEIPLGPQEVVRHGSLQWGRDLLIAEMGRPTPERTLPDGFNGAAIF